MSLVSESDVLGLLPSAFWAALIPAAILSPMIYRALAVLKSTQSISEFVPEHKAKEGTPTMGGLIVLSGLIVAFLFGVLGGPIGRATEGLKWDEATRQVGESWGFFTLLLGFAAIGFIDDFVVPKLIQGKRGLGWMQKLVLQFAVAVPAMWVFGRPDWMYALGGAFIIVACSNAFNLSDGLDGLAGGLAVILALTFLAVGYFWGAPLSQMWLCLALVGALLPFLLLNAAPARVFMGDVGSMPIGAVLGWLMLNSRANVHIPLLESTGWLLALGVACVVLLAELVPVPIQILSVKLLKKRLPIRTPIHHTFQSWGWPETRIVALFHLGQAVASFASISIAVSSDKSFWIG